MRLRVCLFFVFFFFNDTATTEIYTLSLHDALPIWFAEEGPGHGDRYRSTWAPPGVDGVRSLELAHADNPDRKSTRLNSSHSQISYAVFCLKKKNNTARTRRTHLPLIALVALVYRLP